jgi:hypothetical protein
MRAAGKFERIAEIRSRPFIFGMRRSIRAMSGRCIRNRLSASSPSPAEATTDMSDSALISAAIPDRMRGWSSATRIRIGSLIRSLSLPWSRPSNPTTPTLLRNEAQRAGAGTLAFQLDFPTAKRHGKGVRTGCEPTRRCVAFQPCERRRQRAVNVHPSDRYAARALIRKSTSAPPPSRF